MPDSSSSPRVASTLNKHAWSSLLADYPNPVFVATIQNVICHGANLGFIGDRTLSQSCSNLKSAFEHPDAVTSDITSQIGARRIRGPFSSPPLPAFRQSPLGAVTRKRSAKVRRIHHLS
jgi:hypothetical protein